MQLKLKIKNVPILEYEYTNVHKKVFFLNYQIFNTTLKIELNMQK